MAASSAYDYGIQSPDGHEVSPILESIVKTRAGCPVRDIQTSQYLYKAALIGLHIFLWAETRGAGRSG